MKDWIWNRIHALRSAKIVDFFDVYDLGKFENDSLTPWKTKDAKVEKNSKRSPLKQTAQRLKRKQ